jgi:hypothetical protein
MFTMTDPWRDIPIEEPIEDGFPAFIEIPKGSKLNRQLPPHTLKELERFFLDYKVLENKRAVAEEFDGPRAFPPGSGSARVTARVTETRRRG